MIMSDVICKYINDNHADYAIAVNGDWGTGKTYYFRNQIQKYEIMNEPCFVSVSGDATITSILEEIGLQIIAKGIDSKLGGAGILRNPEILKMISMIAGGILGGGSPESSLGWTAKNLVRCIIQDKNSFFDKLAKTRIIIIIDDVERYNGCLLFRTFTMSCYPYPSDILMILVSRICMRARAEKQLNGCS